MNIRRHFLKSLSGGLCALVLCALCLLPAASALENPFDDVSEGLYYYDAVMWAYENNVTGGTTATTFSPASTCTRGQVVTFLWRASGQPEPKSSDNPFQDVRQNQYFYKAVLWAVENGITNGTSAAEFSPGNPCTYAHVITFLWRANGQPAPEAVYREGWYGKAAAWAAENGLLTGAVFRPAAPCPRAHIILYLYRNQTKNPASSEAFLRELTQAAIFGDTLAAAHETGWSGEWMWLYFQQASDPGENYIPSLDEENIMGASLDTAVANGWGTEWLSLYYNGGSEPIADTQTPQSAQPDVAGDWMDEGDGEGHHFSTMRISQNDGVSVFEIYYRGGYDWYFSGIWENGVLSYSDAVHIHREETEYTNGRGEVRIVGDALVWAEETEYGGLDSCRRYYRNTDPETVALTKDKQYQVNIYLSNLSEQRFGDYDRDNPDYEGSGKFIEFVHNYLKINRSSDIKYQTVDGMEYETLSLDSVNSVLDRFFGYRMDEHEAARSLHSETIEYGDRTYYFPAADGESYNAFSVVDKMERIAENTYQVHFYVCELDWEVYFDNGIAKKYYQMDASAMEAAAEVSKIGEGTAILENALYNGSPSYHVVDYSVFDYA